MAILKAKKVYFFSIVILIIAAIFSTGYYHVDEHVQILEFAALKLNLTTSFNLPWEYHCQMRPAIQPAVVVLLTHFVNQFGIESPFMIILFLRLFSAAISFLSMYLIYKSYCKTITDTTLRKWFLYLSFFLWFMIVNKVRFSSENLSGSLFIIAFALLNIRKSGHIFYLIVGLLLGLSFIVRYQTGFLIGGLILWQLFFIKNRVSIALVIFGILSIIIIGILIDRWYYGMWTFTILNYFNQNILMNKVADFGIQPWWFYFTDVFMRAVPLFSIIFIFSVIIVLVYRRKEMLTWTIFPFLIVHFIIGHKETRFLFPIIGFLPIFIIKSIEIIQEKWNQRIIENQSIKIFAKAFWVINIMMLIFVIFRPANPDISLFNKLYSDYHEPANLYYIDQNPYFNVNYYKRTNLEVTKIDSIQQIETSINKKQLFVTRDTTVLRNFPYHKKLIYSTYPDWICRFNFNHWYERTCIFHVYELF